MFDESSTGSGTQGLFHLEIEREDLHGNRWRRRPGGMVGLIPKGERYANDSSESEDRGTNSARHLRPRPDHR